MKMLLLALSLVAAGAAQADNPKSLPVAAITDSPAFDSVDAAALAALERITQPFGSDEKGGAIIERDHRFFYTSAVSSGSPSNIQYVLKKKQTDILVGIYHTQPSGFLQRNDTFSHDDMNVAKTLKVVSFIAAESGAIRRFDPASNPHANASMLARGEPLHTLDQAVMAAVVRD
jgi:hypothetical protein